MVISAEDNTLEIKISGSQPGCFCFLFLNDRYSRCQRREHRFNSLKSAHYFKINNLIP